MSIAILAKGMKRKNIRVHLVAGVFAGEAEVH